MEQPNLTPRALIDTFSGTTVTSLKDQQPLKDSSLPGRNMKLITHIMVLTALVSIGILQDLDATGRDLEGGRILES